MSSSVVMARMPRELLERVDAQGRATRSEFLRAATEFYLAHLQRGTEAEIIRRAAKVAILDEDGNVIKVL